MMRKPTPFADSPDVKAPHPMINDHASQGESKARHYRSAVFYSLAWFGVPVTFAAMTLHPALTFSTSAILLRDDYSPWHWWFTFATLLAVGVGCCLLAHAGPRANRKWEALIYLVCMIAVMLGIDIIFGCDIGDCFR